MDASEETRPRASDPGDVNVTTDVEDTSASVSDDDGSEMDVTSDGGSTVRETNEQENDGDQGNTGKSGNTGIPGTSWERVGRRKRTTRIADSSASSGDGTQVKRSCPEPLTTFVVYIKGVGYDLAKEAMSHPISFKRTLFALSGKTGDIKLTKSCVRVTCLSLKQKTQLLNTVELNGKAVEVSEPWTSDTKPSASGNSSSSRSNRGIIFGISTDLSEEEIAEEVGAVSARRLVKWSGGQKEVTSNVVLSFSEELPQFIYLGFMRRKVKPYIPPPMRCHKCQVFGHHADKCSRNVRCVRCGLGHALDSCPVKDNIAEAVCVNCKGRHSAAYKGCPKYKEVSETLKVSVTDKISYRDALIKVRQSVLPQPMPVVRAVENPQLTSTPKEQRKPRVRPVRRQLISDSAVQQQTTGSPTTHLAGSTTEAGPVAATNTDLELNGNTTLSNIDFQKQITAYLLHTLDVVCGRASVEHAATVRADLYKLAMILFGTHESKVCFTPHCKRPTDDVQQTC